MARKATPEKVKQLLSSFLVSSRKSSEPLNTSLDKTPALADNDSTKHASVKSLTTSSSTLRSYENFLERLDTFSSLTWFGKPTELSPLICARYGWENVDGDMLQCVGCKASLSGQLPTKNDPTAYNKFKEKLIENLLASHDRFCAIAANPCPESFCLVRCDDPGTLTSGFISRISSLNTIRCPLPPIEFSSVNKHGYDEGQGAAYCTRHLLPDSDISPQVVTLSFTGWTKSPSSNDDVLMCSMCRRLVGLWNFSKDTNTADVATDDKNDSSDIDEAPKAKKQKMAISKAAFDPLEEHKLWCPWLTPTNPVLPSSSAPAVTTNPVLPSSSAPAVSVESQTDMESRSRLPACIVALKVIAPGLMDSNTGLAQTLKVSPMVQGMRSFRQVVKAWSSPRSSTKQVTVTTSS